MATKKADKNTRAPMKTETEGARKSMHRSRQMEDSLYHEKYGETHVIMWILDDGGDVDRWIDAGAEPVERLNASGKTFKGLTDRHESNWVRVVGGVDKGGKTVYQYMLIILKDVYKEVKTDPLKRRQAEIRTAMGLGVEAGDDLAPMMAAKEVGGSANKAGLKTYAPFNVMGGAGLGEGITHE